MDDNGTILLVIRLLYQTMPSSAEGRSCPLFVHFLPKILHWKWVSGQAGVVIL